MKKILFIGRTIAMCFALGLSGIGRARADESLYQPYDPDADDTVVVQSGVYGEYDPTDTVGEPTQLIPVAVPAPAAKPAVARMAKLPEPVRYRVAHINRAPYPHGTVVAQGVFAGKPINATARVPSPASLGVGDPRAPRAAARPATKQPIKKPVVVQPVEKPVPAQPDSILPPPKENMNVSVAAVAASTFANHPSPDGLRAAGATVDKPVMSAASVKAVVPAPVVPTSNPAPTNDNLNKIIAAQGQKSVSDFCDYAAIPKRVGAGLPRGFILMPGAPNRMDCKK